MDDQRLAIIIIPYFGRFPNYFPLFLRSCAYNNEIDWLIITDNNMEGYNVPTNVHIKKCYSLSEIEDLASARLNAKIKFKTVRHLCNLRPYYGEVFSEEIKPYRFWAFGDMDLIYGKIINVIPPVLFEKYDVIQRWGHLTFIRNCKLYRDLIMDSKKLGFVKKCLNDSMEFAGTDEVILPGWLLEEEIPFVWDSSFMADIGYKKFEFHLAFDSDETCGQEYIWDDGRLYGCNNGKVIREYSYIHLQKRKVYLYDNLSANTYKIGPLGIMPKNTEIMPNRQKIEEEYKKSNFRRIRSAILWRVKAVLYFPFGLRYFYQRKKNMKKFWFSRSHY